MIDYCLVDVEATVPQYKADCHSGFEFYDPHPGIGGPIVPLPLSLKNVVDGLDGTRMPLDDALERIKRSGGCGTVKVRKIEHNSYMVVFDLAGGSLFHSWRLINFRVDEMPKNKAKPTEVTRFHGIMKHGN